MYSYETAALLVMVCVWAEGLRKVMKCDKIMSKTMTL